MGIKSDYLMTKTSLIVFKTYIFYLTKVSNVQNDSSSMLTQFSPLVNIYNYYIFLGNNYTYLCIILYTF